MSVYRIAADVPAAPVEKRAEWRWVGWFVSRCSRCGARRGAVDDVSRWGIFHDTETATVRHLRECSHVGRP